MIFGASIHSRRASRRKISLALLLNLTSTLWVLWRRSFDLDQSNRETGRRSGWHIAAASGNRPFDKKYAPRSIYSVLGIVNPGGDMDVVQILLMQMREEGLVKSDIRKGL
jgi:hypothetical protein